MACEGAVGGDRCLMNTKTTETCIRARIETKLRARRLAFSHLPGLEVTTSSCYTARPLDFFGGHGSVTAGARS